jgi:protein-disulfide isomerase
VEAESVSRPIDAIPWNAGMAAGPAGAVRVLRVFGDYECPACRELERVAGDTLRALAERGAIRFVYHHAPLRGHRRGPAAAAAAYCATDAGAGWEAHAALYDSAPDWGTGPDGEARLIRSLVPAVGDTAGLRDCMKGAATSQRVAADREAAESLGIREVPTVLLGDRRLRIGSWGGLVRYVTEETRAP